MELLVDPVVVQHAGASLGETHGQAFSDPTAGAGDQNALSLQAAGGAGAHNAIVIPSAPVGCHSSGMIRD